MPGSVSLFHMHALLESDCAILTNILHYFALCRRLKGWRAWHYTPHLNKPLDVHVLIVTAY